MRKRYLAILALSIGLVACGGREETVEETSTEVDSMHQEYIQETPDANAPELLDRPYFEPQYELNEMLDGSSSDVATLSEVDNTVEETVLDGGKELSIKDRVTFIVHDTMNNVDREGETVYLDDYDAIDVGPNAKDAKVAYSVNGKTISFRYEDGRMAEFTSVGTGYISASGLGYGKLKELCSSIYGIDLSDAIVDGYSNSDFGSKKVSGVHTADFMESYAIYRGNGGVYLAKFKGILPYQYAELETDIKFLTN